MRIGLFGGTFNPIHYGHLRAAKEVCEGFELEKLYFIPSALPPHKDIQEVVSAVDRLEMTRLAIADNPEFILSDVELKRPGLSYTIDTVKHFQKEPKRQRGSFSRYGGRCIYRNRYLEII